MKYLDYIKKYDNLDRYIVFLDYIGLEQAAIATLINSSRQHVHQVLKRNQWLLEAIQNYQERPPGQAKEAAGGSTKYSGS